MSSDPHVVDGTGKASFQSPAGEDVVVRATGDETDGAYDLVEVTIPPGPGVTPLHVHHDNDEAMHVIEGEVTVKMGEERHVLEAGAYAMAPHGLPHTYRNSGEDPARVLFTYTPGNHWRYLKETGERGPVEDESDIEELLPILKEYGIEMVGPPLDAEAEG
jgi:mannose-6-phosphate isomerase-like protein (cupin superfamily)